MKFIFISLKIMNINLIVACDNAFGIGYRGTLPWKIKEELNIFKTKTLNSVLIVGRKTYETLSSLKDRTILCVSKIPNCFSSIESAIDYASTLNKEIYVAGGGEIYDYVLKKNIIQKIHISVLNDQYLCDTYINFPFDKWVIEKETKYDKFIHYEMIKNEFGEEQYLNLLKKVLECKERQTRNGETKALFNYNLKYDLRDGLPILTTKKMFFKGIVEELLFFLKGETNTKKLEEKKVNIWKGNTNIDFLKKNNLNLKEGLMGPMYGYQWRYFNAEYDTEKGCPKKEGYDQLKYVIDTIKNDPYSRRIIMTSFNPLQVNESVLYPCHSLIIQFFVEDEYLDMFCYNRSQDVFLGTPFNITSSALLLSIISGITNKIPRYLHITLGDVHIYKEHYEIAKIQLKRFLYKPPFLKIKHYDIDNLVYEDFILVDYNYHNSIKTEMVA